MKKHIYIKWNASLFFITFLLVSSCQQDELIITDTDSQGSLTTTIEEEEIPTKAFDTDRALSLQDYLIGQGLRQARSAVDGDFLFLPIGTVSLRSGLGIISEAENKITYTFPMQLNQEQENTFFTLIVKEDLEGVLYDSYLIAYHMSDSFALAYETGSKDLRQFEGTLQRYVLNSGRTFNDIEPFCEEQEIVNDDPGDTGDGTSGPGDGDLGNDHGDTVDGSSDGTSSDSGSTGGTTGGSSLPPIVCSTTQMVKNCGCTGGGCAEGYHSTVTCGSNPENDGVGYGANASFLDSVQCFESEKSMYRGVKASGCGEEDIIIIEEDETEEDQCDKLTNLTNEPSNVRTRFNQLKNHGGDYEKGFTIDIVMNSANSNANPLEGDNSTHNVSLKPNYLTYSIAHNHPNDDDFLFFSGEDVLNIAPLSTSFGGPGYDDAATYTLFLVAAGRTFALTFDDWESILELRRIYNNSEERESFIVDLRNEYYDDVRLTQGLDTSILKQQKRLFQFLSDYNINATFFEASYTNGFITQWSKINKNTQALEPCQ